MTYSDALIEAISNNELVDNYDRLFGCNLKKVLASAKRQDINFKIDLATGYLKDEIEKFKDFFNAYILFPTLLTNDKISEQGRDS